MSVRRHLTFIAGLAIAVVFFALGSFSAQRFLVMQKAESDAKIDALRAEMVRTLLGARTTTGRQAELGGVATAGTISDEARDRASIVEEVKSQLQREMGLVPIKLLRDRQQSFVELYAYDNYGRSNYGTAGYLGNGYFITVKHGVFALRNDADDPGAPRRIVSIKVMYQGRAIPATVVDSGDAKAEVDRGDWAVIKVRERLDVVPLRINTDYGFNFADPIFRLGNDYSKGIILSAGYVGQRTPSGLITCLTDGHPGVSGGGVLDRHGDLVGIPIGRMQGDYRFSFILPLRKEMFRKIPSEQLVLVDAAVDGTDAE
jgi:hypothetical protein